MAIKRKAHNINWEISVLEAQLGIEPRVKSVKKEAPKNKDPDGKNQSLQANYTDLLLEKLKLKLYHTKKLGYKLLKRSLSLDRANKIRKTRSQLLHTETKIKEAESSLSNEVLEKLRKRSKKMQTKLDKLLAEKNRSQSQELGSGCWAIIHDITRKHAPEAIKDSEAFNKFIESNFGSIDKLETDFVSKYPKIYEKIKQIILIDLKSVFEANKGATQKTEEFSHGEQITDHVDKASESSEKAVDWDSEQEDNFGPEADEVSQDDQFMDSLSINAVSSDDEIVEQELKVMEQSSKSKKKKNRTGQRARQLMWEKLYGKDANHLRKRAPRSFTKPKNTLTLPQDHLEKQLHPSWLAKKNSEESGAIVKPQGRKIVFD